MSTGDRHRDPHLVRYSGHGVFGPDVIARAHGSVVVTEDGRELLDFTSGQMSAILGHSHPEIVATVSRQVAELDNLHSGMLSRPVIELAERLVGTLPAPLERCSARRPATPGGRGDAFPPVRQGDRPDRGEHRVERDQVVVPAPR